MNFGTIIKKIETEIQCIITDGNDVYGVYGFGSFFRHGRGNDIDILVVADSTSVVLTDLYDLVAASFKKISIEICIDIDMTFFTFEEFIEKPLIESNSLFLIYQKGAPHN